MHHSLRGGLTVNGRKISMTGGRGYIETDKGRSFPKSYLWTQCGYGERSSVMLSVADIPFWAFIFRGVSVWYTAGAGNTEWQLIWASA
ncbi:hypothetical protein LC724_36470 [Blautia sp. RD014234]|nr:hypothetical protein [Blautia parvula]